MKQLKIHKRAYNPKQLIKIINKYNKNQIPYNKIIHILIKHKLSSINISTL